MSVMSTSSKHTEGVSEVLGVTAHDLLMTGTYSSGPAYLVASVYSDSLCSTPCRIVTKERERERTASLLVDLTVTV